MSKWCGTFHLVSTVAIAVLKDKEPGAFLIRDSNSFQGAYGLALKVATPPANANITGTKGISLKLLHIMISLRVMGGATSHDCEK